MQRRIAAAALIVLACFAFATAQKTAPAAYRSITVSTEPNAKVWIDGLLYGKTGADGTLAIKSVPGGPHTLRVRADGFRQKEQPLLATQKGTVKVVLVKTTDEAELAFQEAERLLSSDRDKAIEAYEKAIKIKPTAEYYVALARVNSDVGDLEAAEKAIVAARKLRPGYAEASAVLGRIYKESGQGEDKAIAAFKRAITEGKGIQPEAYAGLGLLYKEKAEGFGGSGDFEDEAANYAESAKNLKMAVKQLGGAPDAIVIYQLLGLTYERQKQYKDAIATYEDFLRIFPDTTEASAVRSFITQIKKQMEEQP